MKTTTLSKKDIKNKWHHIDAEGKVLGKIAAEAATKLIGKDKVDYVPYINCGDTVVITNAKKVVLTGNKEDKKIYYSHSGYMGNIRSKTAKQVRKDTPNRMIYEAVNGMLPKNKLRNDRLAKLFIYEGSDHPHAGQLAQKDN